MRRSVYTPKSKEDESQGAAYWERQHEARLADCKKLRAENKQLIAQLRKLDGLARLMYEHGGLAKAIDYLVRALNNEIQSSHAMQKQLLAAQVENARLVLEAKQDALNRQRIADALVERKTELNEWKHRALTLEARLAGAEEYVAPCVVEDPPDEDEKRAAEFFGVPVRYLRTWAALGYGPRPPYKQSELEAYLPWVEAQLRGLGVR